MPSQRKLYVLFLECSTLMVLDSSHQFLQLTFRTTYSIWEMKNCVQCNRMWSNFLSWSIKAGFVTAVIHSSLKNLIILPFILPLYRGVHLIYEEDYSAFVMMALSRSINLSATVSHRDWYSDRCSSSSKQLNSACWSLLIICIHTNTLTMYRHMAGDHQQNLILFETNCRAMFKMFACGCKVIDCNWTRARRSSSGAAHQGVAGIYQAVTSMSMRFWSNQFLLPAILVSLWTVRCQWDPIFLMLLHRVTVECTRPVLYEDRYHPLRWRCSLPVLSTLGWAIETKYSRVCQPATSNDCQSVLN